MNHPTPDTVSELGKNGYYVDQNLCDEVSEGLKDYLVSLEFKLQTFQDDDKITSATFNSDGSKKAYIVPRYVETNGKVLIARYKDNGNRIKFVKDNLMIGLNGFIFKLKYNNFSRLE